MKKQAEKIINEMKNGVHVIIKPYEHDSELKDYWPCRFWITTDKKIKSVFDGTSSYRTDMTIETLKKHIENMLEDGFNVELQY